MVFENIFSKSKQKPPEKISILVDHREKNARVIAELMQRGVQLEFQQLPIADYVVKGYYIERKTVSDLKSSIINRRIFEQIENLKQYEKYAIIVEGIAEEAIYQGGIHENALRGCLLSIILDRKIPLIFTHDAKDTAKYLIALGKREARNDEYSSSYKKIARTRNEKIVRVLESVEGIGPITAKKLLMKFKTITSIANATIEELTGCIGQKAKILKETLNENYQESMKD